MDFGKGGPFIAFLDSLIRPLLCYNKNEHEHKAQGFTEVQLRQNGCQRKRFLPALQGGDKSAKRYYHE